MSPDRVQFESPEGKPEPEIWIGAPTGAEASLKDTDMEGLVTVKVSKA